MCGGPAGPGLPQVGLWGLPGHLTWGPVSGSRGGPGSESCRRRPHLAPCASTPTCHHCRSQISTESFLHLRYQGTDCALMVSAHQHPASARSPRAGDFGAAFVERYVTSASQEPGRMGWPGCHP